MWKGVRRRLRLVLAEGRASAWFLPFWRGPAPGGQSTQAAKAIADQLSDLAPPTIKSFGRLIGRMEEGKGEAYASKIDVRCSDRNTIIAHKNVLIATGGSATAEMAMRYSSFGHWISRTWLAFMDESQQYGNYHEIAALAAIQQPTLTVFIGDHRQTPGGLSKG